LSVRNQKVAGVFLEAKVGAGRFELPTF
jgi:hypothetical protein